MYKNNLFTCLLSCLRAKQFIGCLNDRIGLMKIQSFKETTSAILFKLWHNMTYPNMLNHKPFFLTEKKERSVYQCVHREVMQKPQKHDLLLSFCQIVTVRWTFIFNQRVGFHSLHQSENVKTHSTKVFLICFNKPIL